MRIVYLLLFCFGLGLVIFAFPQKGNITDVRPGDLYHQADSLYERALALNLNKKSNDKEEERLNRLALQKFSAYLTVVNRSTQKPDTSFLFAAVKSGELSQYFDDPVTALSYYRAAIRAKQNLPALPDSFLFKPYTLGGLIYVTQNKLDSALAFLKKAETILTNAGVQLTESERLYNILGGVYYEYGNYRQAKNYFQKAAEVLSKTNPSFKELYINYKLNIATSLYKLEQFDPADSLYRELLRQSHYLENQINNNLGLVQLYRGLPLKAIAYFEKVRYNSALRVGLFNDLATAYIQLNKLDQATNYLDSATAANTTYNKTNLSIDYGRTLKLQGDVLRTESHYDSALVFYQRALHHFYPAFTDANILVNPDRFSGAFSYINLFQTLVAKAETMEALYNQNRKTGWGRFALQVYESAFRLIEYVERTYESDEARLFLSKIKYAVHDKPIDLAFSLYRQTGNKNYLSLLYRFDQQNKAAVLSLNRQLNAAAFNNSSPAAQKELRLKDEITRLSIKAAQFSDSSQLPDINKQIRDNEIELSKLRQNASLGETVDEDKIPSLDFLQSILDAKTVLVSYHLAPEKITAFVVTKTGINCYQKNLPKAFDSLVQREILVIKTPPANAASERDSRLWNLLLSNVLIPGTEQLIVIPDDILAYFPFESLQDKDGSYLIEHSAIQYQFSTALLEKNVTNFSRAQALSIAPFAHQTYSQKLPLLPASEQEVENNKGKTFFDADATKKKFLQYADSFPIVHLATHAVANKSTDNLSYVVFAQTNDSTDNRLYAGEIYNLRLHKTGLVILSACETGAGNLVKGEGVLSLSRAFAYAGCPNVITSLWKADDFSTAYLTTRIHQYLKDGWSIAKAVQAAKLDYLNDKTINPRLKQPYYWSHLIFVGNYSPEKNSLWIWFVVGGMFLLGILLFITKPRKAGL